MSFDLFGIFILIDVPEIQIEGTVFFGVGLYAYFFGSRRAGRYLLLPGVIYVYVRQFADKIQRILETSLVQINTGKTKRHLKTLQKPKSFR